ncbi:DISARM anti-phage system protein DrmE domain-containing protein [Priestia megaterium]|uniref:DISARM anti-phage system protein DrmE domain-containing protein n=1 Tax=Priestia megaterium TaxID=1404 RepID=UPI0032D91971
MSFNNLLDLYNIGGSVVLFKHVKSRELIPLADNIEKFRLETQNRYDNDEHLLEVLGLLRRVLFKLTSSLLPYNKVIKKDFEEEVLAKFFQIKNAYPELFKNVVIRIAKAFKQVIEGTNNHLYDYLCDHVNSKAVPGLKIAIVTKRSISIEEKLIISNELKSFLRISYYTENSFRKDIETFDEVIYVGNAQYFGEYVKNTFKGKTITFISYDIFTNFIVPKGVFEDIDKNGLYNTIFEKITFGKPIEKKSKINIEEESLTLAVNKLLEEHKKVQGNSQVAIEACIVYLENNRFLFAPRDSRIRVFIPHEKSNFVKQINFKEVEEDDYIVIRNDRDIKLIAEVADQDVLKTNAKKYRTLQNEWKDKLRFNVQKKGLQRVSRILMNKYHLKTASIVSVRSWCNEESICPTELPKLLKALKYDEDQIQEIFNTMKEIQHAHRKAGRIISEKLMSELSNNIFKELQEKGFYTFESKEFNGASFNIERIVLINQSRHLIAPYNLMKPMSID